MVPIIFTNDRRLGTKDGRRCDWVSLEDKSDGLESKDDSEVEER